MIGERIAGHVVTAVLGHGRQGTVYEATDEHEGSGGIVALKVLAPQLLRDPFRVERFLEEARVAATIHHPGIIAVHSTALGPALGVPQVGLGVTEFGQSGDIASLYKAMHIHADDIVDVLLDQHRQLGQPLSGQPLRQPGRR